MPAVALAAALALINFIAFALFGADKRKAVRGRRRIRERTLLLWSFLLGGVGAFWGMRAFRHKTKHKLFIICVPLAAILNVLTAMLLFYGLAQLNL